MLPQMMPLPWVFVFFYIFMCLYSISLFISWYCFSAPSKVNKFSLGKMNMPW